MENIKSSTSAEVSSQLSSIKNLLSKGIFGSHIFKYTEVSDLLNLELTQKSIRNQLLQYYVSMTNSIEKEKLSNTKNMKKAFLTNYMNSFVVFNVDQEYDSLVEGKSRSNSLYEDLDEAKTSNLEKFKKSKEVSTTLIENQNTNYSGKENSLFSSE